MTIEEANELNATIKSLQYGENIDECTIIKHMYNLFVDLETLADGLITSNYPELYDTVYGLEYKCSLRRPIT